MEEYFYVQLLLDLQERIAQEVPEIQHIDQQMGQLANGAQGTVTYPALFIDFPEAMYDVDFPEASYYDMSANRQLGNVPVSFQLVSNDIFPTWHGIPVEERKKGFDFLRIEQKLYQALQGWSKDYFSPFSRTMVKSTSRQHAGFKVRELIFTTQYEDLSASPEETKAEIERYHFSVIGVN